ncbi:viroplasmin family protein [Bacillus sp. 1P02SD]|uniref:ribonuclease H1 domain-containing protein n=1 Tax=Bacillus sp. 1P02SD TaxID=3132264 RepID=UPI0039A0583B
MAKKKYYAVKVGRDTGIYETWDECKKQVEGFTGATYKGFSTLVEAEHFLLDVSSKIDKLKGNTNLEINEFINQLDDTTIVAFVDGSYDTESKVYGYGVVLVDKEGIKEEIIGSDNNKDYIDTRNVAGEIEGVQNAITHAVGYGYKKIALFYDYEGIEKWAVGDWKANSTIAKDYVIFINDMKRCIDLEFHKVKAHSGIVYNEKADELAKKSLLKKGIKNNSNGCVTITGIEIEEFTTIFEILSSSNQDINTFEAGKTNKSTNFILSLSSDKIVVTCYKNGTTTIQGKQSSLLEELMRLVVELLPNNGEVIELLNDYHEINIPQEEITLKFHHYLPNFNKIKTNDQKLINTLNQAVFNTMLKGVRPDYTDLAAPSLRAIEYYLYEILISVGIIKEDDDSHGFSCFEPVPGLPDDRQLQVGHQKHFTTQQTFYINELYNFYRNHRNTLNHWDKSGTTRVLKTMEEARELIISNLVLLDKYYTVF